MKTPWSVWIHMIMQIATIGLACRLFWFLGYYRQWVAAWAFLILALVAILVQRVYVLDTFSWDNEWALFIVREVSPYFVSMGFLISLYLFSRIFRQIPTLTTVISPPQPAAIAIDAESTVTAWDASAEALFGWTANEMIGQSVLKLIPPRRQALHLAGMARAMKPESEPIKSRAYREFAIHHDGHEFPVEITVTVLRGDDSTHCTATVRPLQFH